MIIKYKLYNRITNEFLVEYTINSKKLPEFWGLENMKNLIEREVEIYNEKGIDVKIETLKGVCHENLLSKIFNEMEFEKTYRKLFSEVYGHCNLKNEGGV